MDYDKVFAEDIERKFFYTDYDGAKMMVGRISLENAIARLSKREFYTLVTYYDGDLLPEQYVPLTGLKSEDGTLFATLNPNNRNMYNICRNGGIQRISRLMDAPSGSPRYLLGPGPDVVTLEELITEQYEQYVKDQKAQTESTGRGK